MRTICANCQEPVEQCYCEHTVALNTPGIVEEESMRVVNNLTKPGDIRRVDMNPDTVRVVFSNGTEKVYRDVCPVHQEQSDPCYLDAMSDRLEGSR